MKFKYKKTALVTQKEILKEGKKLKKYITRLQKVRSENNYNYSESSINLPFDDSIVEKALKTSYQYKTDKLKYIFIVGVGGSNLGTKAVYDALEGYFEQYGIEQHPKFLFFDTVNPSLLYFFKNYLKENQIQKEEYIVNLVTKSGGTTETIYNFEILNNILPEVKDRLIVTTSKNSNLKDIAKEKQVSVLDIPSNVGGRFSVLSQVGMFPFCFFASPGGVTEGAKSITNKCLNEDITKNPAAVSALITYHHYKNGNIINDNFFFNPELESLGKWYRQLMGESIGKENMGITPTVSIGSADLHSMLQLYLGGPKNSITTFIYANRNKRVLTYDRDYLDSDLDNTDEDWFNKNVPGTSSELFTQNLIEDLDNISSLDIQKAIYQGVKKAYKNQKKPYIEIKLKDISEESLGEYMQFKMIEMMYLGNLLGVNTFNQPNVEEYKEETRKILGE